MDTSSFANTTTTISQQLFQQAQAVIPGGVNSPVRAFQAVGGTPRFITHGKGCWLYDADGNRYVDLVCSWGPMILGHAYPDVVEAIQSSACRGLSFGAPTQAETQLATEIITRVPPVEKVRLVNSGTEATMSALRLARGYTQRPMIIKFAGCYHGHVDQLLVEAGSGVATLGLPASAGITPGCANDTIVLTYNDLDQVQEAFDRYGDHIAAIITEAAPGNMGTIAPKQDFNRHLARLAHHYGALLICDEVMTGFRVSPSGWYGIDPFEADLFTFGKVIGGGMPLAAFGGKAEIMDYLAPTGKVYQAGTLSGNPLATAAGLATLQAANTQTYDRLNQNAHQIIELIHQTCKYYGVSCVVSQAANMFSVFFTDTPVENFHQVKATHTWRYPAFFHTLLEHGVYVPCSAFETWFVSAALTDEAFEIIAAALNHAVIAAETVKR